MLNPINLNLPSLVIGVVLAFPQVPFPQGYASSSATMSGGYLNSSGSRLLLIIFPLVAQDQPVNSSCRGTPDDAYFSLASSVVSIDGITTIAIFLTAAAVPAAASTTVTHVLVFQPSSFNDWEIGIG
jgi:hypothetical protein